MEIKSTQDIKYVSKIMHDAEFESGDFGFNPGEKRFFMNAQEITMQRKFWFLNVRAPIQSGKRYHLELNNVEEYNPINLEKVEAGKALAGVFNYIKIGKNGCKLTIESQDLHIKLKLSNLHGIFEEIE